MGELPRSDDRFRINAPMVTHRTIKGETLIIELESGNYYSLLGVARDIWSLVDRAATVETMVGAIEQSYMVARSDLEPAVTKFLLELQQERLIVPVSGGDVAEAVDGEVRLETAPEGKGHPFEPPVLNKYIDMQDMLLLDPLHETDESGWPKRKTSVEEQ